MCRPTLRREQERDKSERTAAEREIREMSQRATAETQAGGLCKLNTVVTRSA